MLNRFAARVAAGTPADRDRGVDGLRAIGIAGVVLGHWLVTALVADSGMIRGTSPLIRMSWLAPASWLFQTLAVFFLVGGMTAARSRDSARRAGTSRRGWAGRRLGRLTRPVVALLAVWAVAAVVMLAAGTELETVRTLVKLVVSPLWFLAVFATLTLAAPIVNRIGPGWYLATVAVVDLLRFDPLGAGLSMPDGIGWVNLFAGWAVPFCLGARWRRHGPPSRAVAVTLLLGGLAVAVFLVACAGYPVSMVGVPGDGLSNLNPPTLPAVCFGLAQCGAAALLLDPLRRFLNRPVAWAVVAPVNRSAMTVFLWHQTAMITVTGLGLTIAAVPLPGLHTLPDGPGWLLARLGWLPVFAAVLAVFWLAFHTRERPVARPEPVVGDGTVSKPTSGPHPGTDRRRQSRPRISR